MGSKALSVTDLLVSKDNTVTKCPLSKTDWECLGTTKPEVEIFRHILARKEGLGHKPLNLLAWMPGQPKHVGIQAYVMLGSRKLWQTTPGLVLASLPKGTRRAETWMESRESKEKGKAGYGATCGDRSMGLRTAGALQTSCIPILLDPHWYNELRVGASRLHSHFHPSVELTVTCSQWTNRSGPNSYCRRR